MNLELFIRFLHFVGIIMVAGTLVSEHMMLSKTVARSVIKKVGRIDMIYFIAAILVVITGLSMWLWVGKDASYYTSNPLIHIKVTLFVVIALLSIVPSMFFLKNRKGDDNDEVAVPKKVFMFLRLELLLLIAMPYLAVLIARGISF